MKYAFTEIFDIPSLTRLCDSFTELRGTGSALLDVDGTVHIASGWQDICTRFHRVCPDTASRCTESDTVIAGQLDEGKQYNLYRCRNGLVDVAVPVIVAGEHVGNFFTGQFLLEAPDIDFFRAQAEQFGFDERAYLEALSRVPILTEDETRKIMDFLVELTQIIGTMGVERLRTLRVEEQARRDLEAQVAARTRELQEAKEAAEAANHAKTIFLDNMSHELRTPLNAILGFTQIMERDEAFPARQRKNLATIDRAGEHLLSMINDVLDMSKIEAGRVTVERSAFDLGQLLQDIGAMVEGRAEAKQLRFLLEVDPELPRYVVTDAGKLRQILLNLLGNAVKFTQDGGLVLRASSEPTGVTEEVCLRLEVEDTGQGIAEEAQASVFNAFIQSKAYGSDKGTGLGLAISRRLVELLGGAIELRSRIGEGSIFRFHVPAALATAADVVPVHEPRRVVGLAPGQVHDWRILSVEDNPDNRDLMRSVLENVGLAVREAHDGAQGVALFQEWRPHLVLMDIRMPVMDGREAVSRIRALSDGSDCPVIAVSASTFRDEREQIIADGFDDFLRKPYRQSEVYELLERYLEIRFELEQTEGPPSTAKRSISVDDVARLPADWRERLGQHARQGRVEDIEGLVVQVRDREPEVAAALSRLLRDYELERIIELAGG
jgi:signal transduction histidine kinase/CheY-like chemotaxis protein